MNLMKVSLVALICFASFAFAEDGVVKSDERRVEQEKTDMKAAQKNVEGAKDKDALREARRIKAEEKKRLKADKKAKQHE